MRIVAISIALLGVFALIPPSASAADECVAPSPPTIAQSFCVALTVNKPAGAPETPYWDKYYVWFGPGPCGDAPTGPVCRGTPTAPGSGVPLPTSGSVGPGLFGVLWQETNTVDGLQRQSIYFSGQKPADVMVLV